MSYCLNPSCPNPQNRPHASTCQACGANLLLRDRYRIVKVLGKGGFGATFLACDVVLPGKPACLVKQLRPLSSDPDVLSMARKLFEREAQTLGRIGSHPQVPMLLDYFEEQEQFYLIQEYIRGDNLHQEVKKNGPFTEGQLRQFLEEILPVLKYIHSQGVIHRDIKPANIIRREQDQKLVLIDFGAVKDEVNSSVSAQGQTALTAFAVGTPGFAPPEQIVLRPVYASDIYALGITCLYLLTGKPPKDLNYDPSTGELIWPDGLSVSKTLLQLLEKMLEVSLRLRYKSVDQVLHALEADSYKEILAESLFDQAKPIASRKVANIPVVDSSRVNSSTLTQIRSSNLTTTGFKKQDKINRQTLDKSKQNRQLTTGLQAKAIITSYVQGYKDFPEQSLNFLELKKARLSGINFHRSKLMRVNFQEADLSGANLGRTDLRTAVLRNANLEKAYLYMANLEGADLRGANLKEAHLLYANLTGANLCGADLTQAKVSKEQLAKAKTNWLTIMPRELL